MADQYTIDKETGGGYPQGLYNPVGTVPAIRSLEEFDENALDLYNEFGALSVENVYTLQEVQDALDGLSHLLMGGNPHFTEIQYEAAFADRIDRLDATQRMDVVRKLMYFTPHDARLQAMASHPPLLRVIETILGARPRMFQDMALLKPPRGGREKPWHQDKAYFDFPLDTKVVGVWIALDEATAGNGCMHLILASHRAGPVVHFKRRDWQICDTDILGKRCVVAPLKPGGALLFDGMIHHGTPRNDSPLRRRALQFHYAPAGVVEASKDERLKVFGNEGKEVTC